MVDFRILVKCVNFCKFSKSSLSAVDFCVYMLSPLSIEYLSCCVDLRFNIRHKTQNILLRFYIFLSFSPLYLARAVGTVIISGAILHVVGAQLQS